MKNFLPISSQIRVFKKTSWLTTTAAESCLDRSQKSPAFHFRSRNWAVKAAVLCMWLEVVVLFMHTPQQRLKRRYTSRRWEIKSSDFFSFYLINECSCMTSCSSDSSPNTSKILMVKKISRQLFPHICLWKQSAGILRMCSKPDNTLINWKQMQKHII